jgi:hypothetical protein
MKIIQGQVNCDHGTTTMYCMADIYNVSHSFITEKDELKSITENV